MAYNQLGLLQQRAIARKPYFVGFNTVDQPAPPYKLTNIELVKRDILNLFATPFGARVMLPGFGTHIYEYLFDPFDDYTKNVIIQDAIRVIKSEPRVELVTINVQQRDQMLIIELNLLFKPEAVTGGLFVTFSLKDRDTL